MAILHNVVLCFAVASAAASASAGVVNATYHTSGGDAAAGAQSFNDSVVSLTITDSAGGTHYGSGVYLGGRILSSKHLVEFSGGVHATSITVRTGTQVFVSPLETVMTSSYLAHPTVDLSLIYCNLTTAPAAVLAASAPTPGTLLDVCGFGLPYNMNNGHLSPFDNSTRYGGQNTLRNPDPLHPGMLYTLVLQFPVGPLNCYGYAPGDSGGAVWANVGGQRQLVGIIDSATGFISGAGNYAIDLNPYQSWIIPAPNSAVLIGVSSLCFASRRRRSSVV